MITEFGKTCRVIRIHANELLKQMAEKLEVSSSYLSAVETGKKSIPATWPDTIANLYNLDDKKRSELREAAKFSSNNLKIELDGYNKRDKEVLFSFARDFTKMNNDAKDEIIKILRKNDIY